MPAVGVRDAEKATWIAAGLMDNRYHPSKLLRISYHVVAQYISSTLESWARRAS
jgi:hypothetical protein